MRSKQSIGMLWSGYLAFILGFFCSGCNQRASSFEVAHVVSPNGSLEAVLTETNGGATTSFGYEVTLGPRGANNTQRVASLYGAIRNPQAYGVNLVWTNNHVLRIQYLRAKAVPHAVNTISVNGRQIEVELQSGVEDPTAPSGGMQYNLQKGSANKS